MNMELQALEKIQRIEIDADMKMRGLKVVDYELYLRYQNRVVLWVMMGAVGAFIVGITLGLGGAVARAILGG